MLSSGVSKKLISTSSPSCSGERFLTSKPLTKTRPSSIRLKINEIGGTQTLIIELSVEKSDIGKIIGKKGKTINAIRTLLMSVASRNGIRVNLEILEENGQRAE
jgi:hypothetical protein